jgi:uncharacterized protein involved in oxidation of intracellular sulfur
MSGRQLASAIDIQNSLPNNNLTIVRLLINPEIGILANTLFILNDAPYGTERSYNALRLATSLAKNEAETVRVFLMGDAAACARSGQKVPQGYYNAGDMLVIVGRKSAEIGVCGTCMDARGLAETDLVEGAKRSTLAQLTEWTVCADKVLVF